MSVKDSSLELTILAHILFRSGASGLRTLDAVSLLDLVS